MWMGRKKRTNKRGGGSVYVESGRHWRSGAIYVTCAVGNSDWSWQLKIRPKHSSRHSTDTSTDTRIDDQPSL